MSDPSNRPWRRSTIRGMAMLGMSMPLLASAQFALVSQQGSVYAYAYGVDPVGQTAPAGTTGNLDLRAVASTPGGGSSNAVVRTVAEAGRIGINAGVGGGTYTQPPSGPCTVSCHAIAAGSSASVNLYFDVTQAVQASVLLERNYKPGSNYVAGGLGFPFQFEKQTDDGNWLTVSSPLQAEVLENTPIRSRVSGLLDLDVGHYRLQAYYGSRHEYLGTSYDWGGSTITLTSAVPEASTWALMGLGLAGVGLAVRRHRHPVA